jgi:hypothetical protein
MFLYKIVAEKLRCLYLQSVIDGGTLNIKQWGEKPLESVNQKTEEFGDFKNCG